MAMEKLGEDGGVWGGWEGVRDPWGLLEWMLMR